MFHVDVIPQEKKSSKQSPYKSRSYSLMAVNGRDARAPSSFAPNHYVYVSL